ncbi:MAG: ATP-binding cassette domain-containing protein [Pseudomonadota bacterium]|nr:ATP-binding cassette domain-containing protein [Pseudomonadota bacterium]
MNKSALDIKSVISLTDARVTLESEAGIVKILRGINLNVERGEAVGIIGPSGGGKSTMMMVMAGLEKITSGKISIADIDLNLLNEDALAHFRRDNVGIIFQDFHLIPTMTALENVAIPMELSDQKNAFEIAESQLTAVGLDHRLFHYPSQLSGGEQQRVAIARAYAPQPKILLADEPTGNLDGETGGLIVELLFSLHEKQGSTMVLISHDHSVVARCDRVLTLSDGKIAEVKEFL